MDRSSSPTVLTIGGPSAASIFAVGDEPLAARGQRRADASGDKLFEHGPGSRERLPPGKATHT